LPGLIEKLRQLFADDAAHGFAFIDTCQRRFDVMLMNPPFGEGSRQAKGYLECAYPRTKNDVYAAFVERLLGLLHQ
jgi:predicted RNA methylase